MGDWFSVDQIDDDTFAISEYKHWEETHAYLLRGSKYSVLIDTGLGVENIRNIIDEITSSPVKVLTTHAHWDHIGSHGSFACIAVHELEKAWLENHFPLSLQMVKRNLTRYPCDFPAHFLIDDYQLFNGKVSETFRDGKRYDLGNRIIQVIHTPGHSPGHCCFYELDRKYLYSGDLVYCGLLDAFYPTTDPMQFKESIHKIQAFPVERILPAHHQQNVPKDIINRIAYAFEQLDEEGKLKHGSGFFDYGDFQIHI